MAELTLTPEEKAVDHVLDWSDETLGKMVRYSSHHLRALKQKDIDNGQVIRFYAMLVHIAREQLELGGATTKIVINQLRLGDAVLGNYELTLRKVGIDAVGLWDQFSLWFRERFMPKASRRLRKVKVKLYQ